MKKINFKLTFVILLMYAFNANAYEIPKVIKVTKESGINVRSSIDSNSQELDSVYVDYLYDVLGVNVVYYKIRTVNGIEGWIYSDGLNAWTAESSDHTKITILLDSGITMRSEPYNKGSRIVGLAESGETYNIVDVVFSHLKISTPRVPEGWIYIGRDDDVWVQVIQ